MRPAARPTRLPAPGTVGLLARLLASLALAGLLVLLLPGAGHAQSGALGGTLRQGGEPIPDVELVVRDEAGEEVGRVTSDAEGKWLLELPGPGTYQVELLTDTLPPDVALTNPDRNPATLEVFGGLTLQVAFNFDEVAGGTTFTRQLAQGIFSGLKTGLIIAIAAVGLSLVFGTTGLINFAHGELVSFGAIVAWFLNRGRADLNLLLAAPLAVGIGGAFGGGLEAGFFARLRARRVSGFQFLVITIGLSLLFQSVLRLWYGNSFGQYDLPAQSALKVGPVTTTPRDLVVMTIAVAVLVGVAALLQLTRIGKAMRAVSDNRDLAEASGIDVGRVIVTVWVLGGSLAALGGILQGATVNIHYLNGFKLLLLMFAAIILGGLGSAYGAMVGGILVGLASEVSVVWFSSELKLIWALLILIGVLLIRPQGVLGRAERLG